MGAQVFFLLFRASLTAVEVNLRKSQFRMMVLRPRPVAVCLPLRRVAGFSRALATPSTPSAPTPPKPGRRGRKFAAIAAVGVAGVGAISYKTRERRAKIDECLRQMQEKSIPTRRDNINRLANDSDEFDILVVGGGATGAGIALEARLRGLSVACVEQEDFGSGASSKSTKLLWAGSRYLVKGLVKLFSPGTLFAPAESWNEFMGTFNMVMGCFRERTYMLLMNPHLTNWIPIAVPMDKWIIWPPPFDYPPAALGPMCGLFVLFFKFYDALGAFSAPGSFVMTSTRARAEFPQLDASRMKYVPVFYEGAHNDARTNLAIALTAASHGACMVNYCPATAILWDANGRASGVEVKDSANIDRPTFKVRAKKVIYAGGPFTDGLRQLSEGKDVKPVVNGSGGTHIVLPQYYCPRNMGMVDMMTSRGSFLFFLPWEGYTLVGTTDVKARPEMHHQVPEDEIQYLVNECERYLSPNLHVRRRDVMSAWHGIRPLAIDPTAKDSTSASRDHVVSHHETNGITFVSGGKWTTWREMSEDCMDQVLERNDELRKKAGPSKTLQTPLLGIGRTEAFPEGWHENLAVRLSQQYDLAYDVAQHLARTYGTRAPDVLKCVEEKKVKASRSGLYKHYPRLYEGAAATTGYPYLEAEVLYAVQHEYAVSPTDVLARRTRLAFLNSTAARLALPRVVQIMGDYFGWDEARCRKETEAAEELLAQDFAGPVPNKEGAVLRTACTADVKDIFDKIDAHSPNPSGALSRDGINAAAKELGFPLSQAELDQAMGEMSVQGGGKVSFPEFLSWWNSSTKSEDLYKKIFRGTRGGSDWKYVEE